MSTVNYRQETGSLIDTLDRSPKLQIKMSQISVLKTSDVSGHI